MVPLICSPLGDGVRVATPMGVLVEVRNSTLSYIESKHPEMSSNRRSLIEALERPDGLIKVEERGRFLAFKVRSARVGLGVVVVYDESGRLITAYKTRDLERLKRRYVT